MKLVISYKFHAFELLVSLFPYNILLHIANENDVLMETEHSVILLWL